MIQLIQVPWSPFCLVQKRILEYGGIPHKISNIPPSDRSWSGACPKALLPGSGLKDGRNFLFEIDDNSQVIAKYLDAKFQLGLFPPQWDGIERIIWRYIENEIEGLTFS
jgi:glutathione S-transferase